jgi:hypothetical protein
LGTDTADWFAAVVADFARELGEMLAAVLALPGTVTVTFSGRRALIELLDPHGAKNGPQVTIRGEPALRLLVRFGIRPDSSGRYIAVTASIFGLYSLLDRSPLFRLEYRDDMRTVPAAHWQVHAERGALSHILTLRKHDKPHLLAALHLPVGGARMRPCLEDFLQFAIEECGVDAHDGYGAVLAEGRTRWRRRQIATAVRDVPDEAVRVLRQLGYEISEPLAGAAPVRQQSLADW